MKRITALLVAIVFCAVCSSVYGLYEFIDRGTWPKSWPAELEPLRKQSRTYSGPMIAQLHYQIPFAKREDFEAAWPHLLAVKSKGAPVILLRGPHTWLDTVKAGVVIHCPPEKTDRRVNPEEPIAGVINVRERWMNTNYIELIVDGGIVDLNRIPLPADTPIVDERFKGEEKK